MRLLSSSLVDIISRLVLSRKKPARLQTVVAGAWLIWIRDGHMPSLGTISNINHKGIFFM